jgi:LysM repeat protein
MKYFVVLFLCLSSFVFAQQEKTIAHKVAKEETISQISKIYNVSISEIYKINPEAAKGVKENDILQIPNNQSFTYNIKKSNVPVNVSIRNHTVAPKETLYGIAKQYNLSVSDIESANVTILKEGIKAGQTLSIPEKVAEKEKSSTSLKEKIDVKKINSKITSVPTLIDAKKNEVQTTDLSSDKKTHVVQPKETLFSIARLYNVSVQDLDSYNEAILKDGLRIGQSINIPNKKKTLDGKPRIINSETVFHVVVAKETKYSIAKKYGITIEQLENQNPEIINGLSEGNRLAINTTAIKPSNDNEELMVALAEKQVAIEKNKAKTIEIEDLQDKLVVQKQMNQKILKVNALKVNLNQIDETQGGSAGKLKLVLEANKNIQEILISKLDSLVFTMNEDLVELKNTEIEDLAEAKRLERASYKNIGQTNEMLQQLKRDLSDNRKIYSQLMNKVQRINFNENHEYKKKVNENSKIKKEDDSQDLASLESIKMIQSSQEKNNLRNELLFTRIDSIATQKNVELKRRISKATFYGSEAREYDDRMAMAKLKRYQKKSDIENKQNSKVEEKQPSQQEIKETIKNEIPINKKIARTEVLKNLKEVENGYYLVIDVFTDAEPRDKLTMRLTDMGELNTGFFYNVNILSYYVYTKKHKTLEEALYEYKQKVNNPFYEKMFVVQIDND